MASKSQRTAVWWKFGFCQATCHTFVTLCFIPRMNRTKYIFKISVLFALIVGLSGCVGLFDAGAWRPVPPFKLKRDSIPDSLNQSSDTGYIEYGHTQS